MKFKMMISYKYFRGMHQSGQDRLIITNNKKVPTLT